MRTHPENSVMTALADVIDLEQARARRAAEANALAEQAAQEAQQSREREERQARERAEQLARLEKARQAREEAEARQAATREARLEERLAERKRRIQAETEAEIAHLRLQHARRLASVRRWIAPVAISAMLLLVGAVGCLVGTTLKPDHTMTPMMSAAAMDAPWLRDAKHTARRVQERTACDADFRRLEHPVANDTEATAALPIALAPTRRAHRPYRPVSPATTPPRPGAPDLCSQLGALGCLRD